MDAKLTKVTVEEMATGACGGNIIAAESQIAEMREVLTWIAKQCSHDQYEVGNCEHTRARVVAAELRLTEVS